MYRFDRTPFPIVGCLFVLCAGAASHHVVAAEPAGVTVRLEKYNGPATIRVEAVERFKFKIAVDPQTETRPLTIRVELPISGRGVWPIADVEVLDAKTRPVAVRRSGIEWHKLLITVPATRSTYLVHTAKPAVAGPSRVPEKIRHATDAKTGLSATICRWHGGRKAALSIRFDDSHPTHLSKVIPILNKYRYRGTFMINPGGHPPNSRRRSTFEEHRTEWEAVAKRGRHEFANHTLHHRGAKSDADMEQQVGDAAKAIWKLFPGKSKLVALNLGGGTQWVTTKTLRYYLDKYHLFDASANSTGMDDSYGNRVATLRRLLTAHIQRGLWYKIHYHSIGKGHSSSQANFRAALDIIKSHEADLWIAGMADIHKYQTERNSARLAIENDGPARVRLRVSCATKPALFDQPLTIEVALPKSWPNARVIVKNKQGQAIAAQFTQSSGRRLMRFDAAPRDGVYQLLLTP